MESSQEKSGEKKGLLSSGQKKYGGDEPPPEEQVGAKSGSVGSKAGSMEQGVVFSPSYERIRPATYAEDSAEGTASRCLICGPRPLVAALIFFVGLSMLLTVLLILVSNGIIHSNGQANTTSLSTESVHHDRLMAQAEAPRLASLFDYEEAAKKSLSTTAWSYYSSGSMEEITLKDNVAAYRRLRLRPTHQVNVSGAATLPLIPMPGGGHSAIPIGFSPTASHWLAHPYGENATARAAAAMGTVMIVSIDSTIITSTIAEAAPDALLWQQMYVFRDQKDTLFMVRLAERSGCKALVLTVDKPAPSLRYPELRGIEQYPVNFPGGINYPPNMASGSGYYKERSWQEVRWLKNQTTLPVIIKGVLTAKEARQAVEHGAAGIIVSNHGGRALDGVPATIDQLAEVVAEVKGEVPIYVDGGIRSGADVFKALALGAEMVFIGRPVLWGLAQGGQKGVEDVVTILKDELINTMQLIGAVNISAVKSDFVYRQQNISPVPAYTLMPSSYAP